MAEYKYICIDCGALFDEPAHWEERHGFPSPPYEQFTGCPFCHGVYADAAECDVCGAALPLNRAKQLDDGTTMCFHCYNELHRADDEEEDDELLD